MQHYPTEIDTAAGRPLGARRWRFGRPAWLAALVLAAALGVHAPAARAMNVSPARSGSTNFFCQLSTTISDDVFKLPEIGGSFGFPQPDPGSFVDGLTMGTARLTGTVVGADTTFAVDVMLEGRLDPGDPGYRDASDGAEFAIRCGSTEGWHYYTSLRGTLRGIGADDFNGAVYNLTLDEGFAQVGYGATTHSNNWGGFARISFELADPVAYPSLPTGPFAGEMAFDANLLPYIDDLIASATVGEPLDLKDYIRQKGFPKPSPDLIGTWEGTTDCAGLTDGTATQAFSGPMLLKVGAQWGWNYPVELSDAETGALAASYCAQYSDDFGSTENGSGRMIGADGAPSNVFLKVNQQPGLAATLKARGLIYTPDGPDWDEDPDGLSICKWSFTRIDTAVPQVATVCSSGMVITP